MRSAVAFGTPNFLEDDHHSLVPAMIVSHADETMMTGAGVCDSALSTDEILTAMQGCMPMS